MLAALLVLHTSGHTVTIVSNNSSDAVRAFVAAHDLAACIHGVVARTDSDPELLKPNPHLVRLAIGGLNTEPARCVLIGDSVTDTVAAHAAGAAAIAFVNRTSKRAQLVEAGPEAIVDDLIEITCALG